MEQAKIAKALCAAQKAFAPALKTNTNPHFKSKYAALDACVEAVIDALNANGVYLMQKTHDCETGVKVETVFIHESGEQLSAGVLHVPASKHDAQGYGSALTYARRYSLMAGCGIAPEDDDGNAASQPVKRLPALNDKEAEQAYNAWTASKLEYVDDAGIADNDKITEEWQKLASNVRSAIKRHGETLKATEQLDKAASQHINEIAKG